MQIGSVELYNGDKNVSAFVAVAVNFTEFAEKGFPDRFLFEEGELPKKN